MGEWQRGEFSCSRERVWLREKSDMRGGGRVDSNESGSTSTDISTGQMVKVVKVVKGDGRLENWKRRCVAEEAEAEAQEGGKAKASSAAGVGVGVSVL